MYYYKIIRGPLFCKGTLILYGFQVQKLQNKGPLLSKVFDCRRCGEQHITGPARSLEFSDIDPETKM